MANIGSRMPFTLSATLCIVYSAETYMKQLHFVHGLASTWTTEGNSLAQKRRGRSSKKNIYKVKVCLQPQKTDESWYVHRGLFR